MAVKIIGLDELERDLSMVIRNIKDLKFITTPLIRLEKKYAHVDTGYMRANIYHRSFGTEATAPYSGVEADRGGSHDFGQRAINAFDFEKYADHIMEPL